MKKQLLIAALLAATSQTGAAELGVLTPVEQDKTVLMRARPDGKGQAPVLSKVTSGSLYDALQQEARRGTTAAVLQLDELAMQVAGQRPGPTWLMLSQEDGGFARRGFWLQAGGAVRWVDEPVVDLVVSPDSVADGSFEEIFAHELGHVMLRRLLPNLPSGYSRAPHHSYTITDQPTAFDEGWATHFQALARALTVNPRLRAQDLGLGNTQPYLPLWQSNLDREWRITGIRRNWFVHQQADPGGSGDPVERIGQSVLFDPARLKSGAQMLASEGVVATFFYRQLVPSGEHAELGRSYAPMFRAMHALARQPLTPDTPLLPQLAAELSRIAPQAGQRFARTLVETSSGALLSPQLRQSAEAVGASGRFGDAETFVPVLKSARKQLAAALEQAVAHPEQLLAEAGPSVWLLDRSRTTGGEPLAIDLNTAELPHLLALPGMDQQHAVRALASRREQGNFKSVADFARRAGLDEAAQAALQTMQQALRDAGPFARE